MQTNKTRSATPLDECRVYVGTYGKYNNGSIFGKWVELSDFDSQEDFYNFCKGLHKDEEDPEFMFQDFEAPEIFEGLIHESGFREDLLELSELLEDEDIDMIAAYIQATGSKLDSDTIEQAKDSFYGRFDSDTDLAHEYVESIGLLHGMPETVERYFDYEAFGRDLAFDFMEFNGYYFSNY